MNVALGYGRRAKSIVAAGVLAGCIGVSAPAHAWFFFFIPGGLFTSKGDTCVPQAAKAGDSITKPDGSVVIVKSLSGTSSRCSNADYPILAEVEPSPSKLPANVSQARIDLPFGWSEQTVTDGMKSDGVVVYALNRTFDAGLQLYARKRSSVTSVADYAESRKATQLSRLKEAEQFPTLRTTVGGLPAWRYEVRGRVPNGVNIQYTTTVIEGEQEVVSVVGWSSVVAFDNNRTRLVNIADSLRGLAPPSTIDTATQPTPPALGNASASLATPQSQSGPVSNSAPPPNGVAAPGDAPVAASSTAQKLRELNSLFKEGLITREEYDKKHKQLVDSL